MRYFQMLTIILVFCLWNGGQVQAQTALPEATLEDLVALKAEMVKKNELGRRYVIQLGSYSSMTHAEEVLKEFKENYPDTYGRMQYESPNYKVWVGSFTSRLAAERLFVKVKEEFKSAFVFRPR